MGNNNIEIPKFENDNDLRIFLLDILLEVVVNLKTEALKKGNIRKPMITKTKVQQYKVCIDAIRATNMILKDKQVNNLENQLKILQKGLVYNDSDELEVFELSDEVLTEIENFEKKILEAKT